MKAAAPRMTTIRRRKRNTRRNTNLRRVATSEFIFVWRSFATDRSLSYLSKAKVTQSFVRGTNTVSRWILLPAAHLENVSCGSAVFTHPASAILLTYEIHENAL